MADQADFAENGYNFFINNCMGSFFRGTLNWWADVFYPRINYRVIGTYDKAVEYFTKKKTHEHEIDRNILPSITLDPAYEFQPAEVGGRFYWQYPLLSSGLGKKLYNRIPTLEEDQSISLVPVFTRYEGAFDLTFWLHSVYELFDVRVYMLQFCGGLNRQIRPAIFDSFITVPQELVDYEYTDSDGNSHTIDWSQTDLKATLVENTGHYHYTLPTKLTPMYKLASLSDSSEKFGGDNICKYKLTATFEYEIDLPTYMVMTPYCGGITPNFSLSMDSTYSRYGLMPTQDPITGEYESGGGDPPITLSTHDYTTDPNAVPLKDFDRRVVYIFTEDDEINYNPVINEWFSFNKPIDETLTWENCQVISYEGLFSDGDNWRISEDGTKIEIKLAPIEGEIVEIFFYN